MSTTLPVGTADNTYIHADTLYFTADNACLDNGGGTLIQQEQTLVRGQPGHSFSEIDRFY